MRKTEWVIAKIIDCMIQHKRLTLQGEHDSFFSHFKIKSDGKGGYDSSNSIMSYKTLENHVKDLVENGIFVIDEENGISGKGDSKREIYRMNPKLVTYDRPDVMKEWRDFVGVLMDNGEFDTYLMVAKKLLNSDHSGDYLDESEIKIWNQSVKENIEKLKADKSIIMKINEAFENNYGLYIEYKKKTYRVDPICYVLSMDGTRTYLYCRRKGKIVPYDLSYIKITGSYPSDIDTDQYKEEIRKAWDVDVQESVHVKLCYDIKAAREDCFDQKNLIEYILEQRLGNPVESSKDRRIYEGDICGINDLKAWLRSYSEYCYIMEPEWVRDGFIKALQTKKERYEEA